MVGKKVTAFDVVLVILMVLLSCVFLYPLLNMLALSFCDAQTLKASPVYLLPVGFSLESYKALLNDDRILLYYWNTIKYAAVGTVIMLLTTSLMAYPLSIPALREKTVLRAADDHDVLRRRPDSVLCDDHAAENDRYILGDGAAGRDFRV